MSVVHEAGLSFPLVVKPDQGERGKGIEVVHAKAELQSAVGSHPTPFLIQPYLDLPFEAGVFYVRMPNEPHGRVTSVVVKGFLTVTGNGQDTLETLALQNMRAALIWNDLKGCLRDNPQRVLDEGEVVVLESIGNHSRGTAFLDGRHLIEEAVVEEANRLASCIPGFFYGRFDLRAPPRRILWRAADGNSWKSTGPMQNPPTSTKKGRRCFRVSAVWSNTGHGRVKSAASTESTIHTSVEKKPSPCAKNGAW